MVIKDPPLPFTPCTDFPGCPDESDPVCCIVFGVQGRKSDAFLIFHPTESLYSFTDPYFYLNASVNTDPITLLPPKDLLSCSRVDTTAYCKAVAELPPPESEISDYCAIGFGTPGQKPVHTLLYRNGTYAVDPSKVTEEVFKKAFVIGG